MRIGKCNKVEIVTAVFGTFTPDLEGLREFLRQYKLRRVGDGIHRRILDCRFGMCWSPALGEFDLVLVNSQHLRALKGEKTDDKDCRRL